MFIERVVEQNIFIIRHDLVAKFNELIYEEIGLLLDPIRTLASVEQTQYPTHCTPSRWHYKMIMVVSLTDNEVGHTYDSRIRVEDHLSDYRSTDRTINQYVNDVKWSYINSIDPQGNSEFTPPNMTLDCIKNYCYDNHCKTIDKVREMFREAAQHL